MMLENVGFALLLAGGACLLTCLLQIILQPVAHRFELIDYPKGRKDHERPTPVIGGLAMALGAVAVMSLSPLEMSAPFYGFVLGGGLLLVIGLLDDKYDLHWTIRIVAQVLAALLMVYIGGVQVERLGPMFGLGETQLGALAVPFTVFATVGLINSVNMIDGADGLAGSLVFAALIMLTAAAFYSGNQTLALRLAVLSGAVSGFLAYNLRFPWRQRAKLFMGNAGSMFLGFVVAWSAFRLTQDTHHNVSPVLALWLIPIPVMDTLVLMVRRLRSRKSPFIADRNHIHHFMLEAGIGPTRGAMMLSLFSLASGLLAAQSLRWDVPEPLLLLAFIALCLLWFWMTGHRERTVAFFRQAKRVMPDWRGRDLRADGVPAEVKVPDARDEAR